jgi:hypothetical protein
MPRMKCVVLVSLLLLIATSGCGGSGLEDYELSSLQADAAEAAYNIAAGCLSGSTAAPSDFSKNVDKLLDTYSKSKKDSEVKQTMRETAGTLRDCGHDDQAARLERATDD